MRFTISGRSLGVNEKLVLSAIQHDATKSVRKIASELSMRHHTVSYIIDQLKERSVIRPYVLVNPHAVGLTDYCIFFNYSGKEKGARKKILEHCLTSQKVAYFAELSGPYQYSVSLFCNTIFEVRDFFESLSDKLSDSIFDMSFALRLQFAQFTGRWHSSLVEPQVIDREEVKNIVQIDETDQKILGFCSQNASLPLEKVGEFAGVSEASVRKRLSILEKKEVITAYAYFVDLTKVNMTTFRVIITGGGMKTCFRDELYSEHSLVFRFSV